MKEAAGGFLIACCPLSFLRFCFRLYQHFLQGSYPLDSASDCVTCTALFGFIFPQLLIL